MFSKPSQPIPTSQLILLAVLFSILGMLGIYVVFIMRPGILESYVPAYVYNPGANSQTPPPVIPPVDAKYVKVKSLNGSGPKKTEPFTIQGAMARITYSVTDNTGYGACIFSGTIISTGGLDRDLFANSVVKKTMRDETIVYLEGGSYYLDISSANCKWSVKVEDYR